MSRTVAQTKEQGVNPGLTVSLLCLMSLMQILSQANQNQSQQHATVSSASSSSSSSQIPPPPSLPPPPGLSPAQFILHSSLPLVGCTKTPPSLLHPSIGGGCVQTPPSIMPVVLSGVTGSSGETGWDSESKDPDKVKFSYQGSWLSFKYTCYMYVHVKNIIIKHCCCLFLSLRLFFLHTRFFFSAFSHTD